MIKVLTHLDQITTEWLTVKLRDVIKNAHVSSFKIQRLTDKQASVTGEVARLILNADTADLPKTLIIKIASANTTEINYIYSYAAEVQFYATIANQIELRTPRCYHSAIDLDSDKSVLLLEDMTPHVSNLDNWDDCSIEEAKAAIQHIAKFHATYWEKSITWVRQFKSVEFKQFQTSYLERWALFLEKCGDHLPAQIKEVGETLGEHVIFVLNHIFGTKQTAIHGDYHRGNLFFLDTPNEGILPTVIDWQAFKWGCGVFDVAFFLSSSVTPQVRQQNEIKLLRMYHQILVENGVQNYSFEQCWFDYRISLLESLFRIVYLVGLGVLKKEMEQSYCHFGLPRICASIIDLNLNALLAHTSDRISRFL